MNKVKNKTEEFNRRWTIISLLYVIAFTSGGLCAIYSESWILQLIIISIGIILFTILFELSGIEK